MDGCGDKLGFAAAGWREADFDGSEDFTSTSEHLEEMDFGYGGVVPGFETANAFGGATGIGDLTDAIGDGISAIRGAMGSLAESATLSRWLAAYTVSPAKWARSSVEAR